MDLMKITYVIVGIAVSAAIGVAAHQQYKQLEEAQRIEEQAEKNR